MASLTHPDLIKPTAIRLDKRTRVSPQLPFPESALVQESSSEASSSSPSAASAPASSKSLAHVQEPKSPSAIHDTLQFRQDALSLTPEYNGTTLVVEDLSTSGYIMEDLRELSILESCSKDTSSKTTFLRVKRKLARKSRAKDIR